MDTDSEHRPIYEYNCNDVKKCMQPIILAINHGLR